MNVATKEISVTLPDSSVRVFKAGITAREVAFAIGHGLGKSMIASCVDGIIKDHDEKLLDSCNLRIITKKDPEALEIIRHSTAHLMAHAVKSLYPSVQITIGPVIENGFYYDFYYPEGFKESDFEAIENKMSQLVSDGLEIKKSIKSRLQAKDFFTNLGEIYKAKIIDELIDSHDVSLYEQGDFVDLCRGPHVPNTSFLGSFKLTAVSGAYWRGDQNNEMLQRIYGTAWPDNKQLKSYLDRVEMAKLRDHRSLGQKLDWFHLQEEAPGMIFWHHNGWKVIQQMKSFQRECLLKWGYKEVNTPQVIAKELWEASGHWDKYQENIFVIESESRTFALKPMNCPGHVELFKHSQKSYRDLPLRYAEFGCCHRNEASGTLHGLMRVRGFVQDDGHIFCHEDDIGQELKDFVKQVEFVYKKYGFNKFSVCLSTRPEVRVGSDDQWDKAENMLTNGLNEVLGADGWSLNPGEGAFYGPKVEFTLHDCMERNWQCGTIQLDFEMPKRLGATFVDRDNARKHPVMLHRAILGSFERFLGILIEENDGRLPFWLMPVQVVVMSISESQDEYCNNIYDTLQEKGIRVEKDLRYEKIGFKIREHSRLRVPYLLICGSKEQESNLLTVRDQFGKDLGQMSIDKFIEIIGEKN